MPPKHHHKTGKWSHGPKTLAAEKMPPVEPVASVPTQGMSGMPMEGNPMLGKPGLMMSGLEGPKQMIPDSNNGPVEVPPLGPPSLPLNVKNRRRR